MQLVSSSSVPLQRTSSRKINPTPRPKLALLLASAAIQKQNWAVYTLTPMITESSLLQTCQLSWFQCKSHSLVATQANLTGSSLCHVNIYKCHPNGVSDADFVPQGKKCSLVLETVTKFAYHDRRHACSCMRLNRIYVSCASDTRLVMRLVMRQFLTRNCRSSCSGCGLQVTLLGPHPPDNPLSRFLN